MPECGFGILLIGDELLSGKRRDKHQAKVIELLHERGLDLAWALTVGDDPGRLVAALRHSMAGPDVVFSFGGIGATPDDRTRQAAAAAAGVALEINAAGKAELEEIFGDRLYPKRIRMAEWPVGAVPIPNPRNRVPGFSLGHHHFVPGFPSMAWPMAAWVLDTQYPHLQQRELAVEYMLEALDTPESELIDAMDAVIAAHPTVRLSCLPNAGSRRAIEFGLRGPAAQAAAAYRALAQALRGMDVPMVALRPPDPAD